MDGQSRLSILVAAAENDVIGKDGQMPWHLPSDLAHFKRISLGKPVLMGRKTWESLFVQPLPGRPNLVLSRNAAYQADGAEVFTDLDEMIARGRALAGAGGEAIIIGGETLYRAALAKCDRVYMSRVAAWPDGDTFFPKLDDAKWRLCAQQPYPITDKDDHAFVTQMFERV